MIEIRDQIIATGLVDGEPEVSPREVRVQPDTQEDLVPLADFLRSRFDARPELIVAEDTRAACGRFTLRHIFEIDRFPALVVVTTRIRGEIFPSLATRWYLASLFEREIHDLFGLIPVDHPDLRRQTLHQFWPEHFPLRREPLPPAEFSDDGAPFPFREVKGEGIYEITVGPVHAGIIEPGHFRFSVEGETIVNLEARLYFVHKGIEKLFESIPWERGVELAERVSGDSSFAHPLACCQALESLAHLQVPRRARLLRSVLLELERLYNHIADVGAICADTGFALANAHAMRLREDLLRLNKRLMGHRLLRGILLPGGLKRDLSVDQLEDIAGTVRRVLAEFDEVVRTALSNPLVLDRLHGTGMLTQQTARELQVCGLAGRASGIDRDARRDHPFDGYVDLDARVPVFTEGDVWARLMVRVEEARESVRLILEALQGLDSGAISEGLEPLPTDAAAFGLVEGWRGPIWYWVATDTQGCLRRVKIKDPSFANWPALGYAILNNIVPDFPLVNKSFNLSYAGNDL